MLEVATAADLVAHVGRALGSSDWLTVDQAMIDAFAHATGDHQWIHVDVERARRELPGGRTIAHGFLTLSLIPRLSASVLSIAARSRGVNYGSDRVRFIAPVPAGSRVRLHATLHEAVPIEGGWRLTMADTIEIEGQPKPALVASVISLAYD